MKMQRVMISGSILAAVVLSFFLLPLPVSRILETGLVQIKDDNISRVFLSDPGYLELLSVRDGEWVTKDKQLAVFRNPKIENELAEIQAQLKISHGKQNALLSVLPELRGDVNNRGTIDLQADLTVAQSEAEQYAKTEYLLQQQLDRLRIRAPRDGFVMTPPKPDEIGKLWDKGMTEPFCSIGDPKRLRILVPVEPIDFRLLKEDLAGREFLSVSILIPGRMDHIYQGKVTILPETDANRVPIQLTHRGGGTLAVRPNGDPNVIQPLAQTYLISIDILDPDGTLTPGTLAEVKIHTKWRSAAWWAWRGIASALDLGLI